MAIYINVGHVPSDGGKPWKHMNGRCAFLQELAEAGFPIKRVPNTDGAKPLANHARRRCDCFIEQLALPKLRTPRWLQAAQATEARARRPSFWTYNIYDPEKRDSQVGMASDLSARLLSRWRATCKPGFPPDGIPWLNARLAEDKAFQPTLEVRRYASRDAALAAERKLRRRLRVEGWHVSSDI